MLHAMYHDAVEKLCCSSVLHAVLQKHVLRHDWGKTVKYNVLPLVLIAFPDGQGCHIRSRR